MVVSNLPRHYSGIDYVDLQSANCTIESVFGANHLNDESGVISEPRQPAHAYLFE